MQVVKRNGRRDGVHFDKITSRITRLAYGLNARYVDPVLVSQKVCQGVYDGVTTRELDELAAETAAHLMSTHPDFGLLAARIAVSNLHKSTLKSFSQTATVLYHYVDPRNGLAAPMLSTPVWEFIQLHRDVLDSAMVYDRDFGYDYFGFKTLERSYLLKANGQIVERPQHMLMRVAVGIHTGNLGDTIKTYNLMSQRWFTHATPTLFNAGTPLPQLSSCFLLSMSDSIRDIYGTLTDCALISKQAGGIGVAVSNVRATGSYIRGTNGASNGLVPMLRVFNATARYVDQGGGKRKGAFAIYIEPWHADIFAVLDLRKNHGSEEERARDLFYGLWIPDLFMQRVEADESWSLFCPNEAPGLTDAYGDTFDTLYLQYEARPGLARKVIKARKLWQHVVDSQQETGTPYMMYKDAVNRKSNQQNLGTIHCSNLCVHGDTLVLTRKGNLPIRTLVGTPTTVWNGEQWSSVVPVKTSTNQSLVRVTLHNGTFVDCTPYHKFYDDRGNQWRAAALVPGTELEQCVRTPFGIDGTLVDTVAPTLLASHEEGVVVKSVSPIPGLHDTYCFTESLRHRAVFNGILTGNCSEITQYTSPEEIAVCNLASIALPMFVQDEFDHQKLFEIVCVVTRNLNRVIDVNHYPVPQAEYSNKKNRPIGIGVQGLADTFLRLRLPFDSDEARKLNRHIFETIYFAALTTSCALAQEHGPYDSYRDSPVSRGDLQFDMWGVVPDSGRWNWDELRDRIAVYGVRNSLLVAPMPTASTSQILGNNEACEPYTSNIYTRRTLAGEFVCVSRHLLTDLIGLGLWSPAMKDEIVAANGSVQGIAAIPDDLKRLYRTVWEIPQRAIIDMAADRGAYIDQSQSLNIHMVQPTYDKLSSMHFHGWKRGLKTGMYYLRTKAATDATKFTLNPAVACGESCSA